MKLMALIAITVHAGFVVASSGLYADAPPPPRDGESRRPTPTKATYLLTGLHCPPCTRTVEASLKSIKGVRSASVDWNTKNAKIEFDENTISAQQLSESIARTPHMMGENMQYGGWLALKVKGVKNEDVAKKARKAIEKLKQVARVSVYPNQDALGIAFKRDGRVTTQELVQVLKDEGLTATNYP